MPSISPVMNWMWKLTGFIDFLISGLGEDITLSDVRVARLRRAHVVAQHTKFANALRQMLDGAVQQGITRGERSSAEQGLDEVVARWSHVISLLGRFDFGACGWNLTNPRFRDSGVCVGEVVLLTPFAIRDLAAFSQFETAVTEYQSKV